jgi:hypothetical protein
MLRSLRRLRELIKLIDSKQRPVVVMDFEDKIGNGTSMELQGMSVGTGMDRFRPMPAFLMVPSEPSIVSRANKRS